MDEAERGGLGGVAGRGAVGLRLAEAGRAGGRVSGRQVDIPVCPNGDRGGLGGRRNPELLAGPDALVEAATRPAERVVQMLGGAS